MHVGGPAPAFHMTLDPGHGGMRVRVSRLALWALGAFIFMIPADSGIAIPGMGSLSRTVGMVALGMALVSIVAGGQVRFRRPSLFVLFAVLFTAWSAATVFWSIAPSITIGRANTVVQLAIMAWLLHQLVRDDRDLDFVWQAFVLGCCVMIGTGLLTFLGGSPDGFRDVGGRNPNGFAIIAALGIPMAWGLASRRAHGWLSTLNTLYPILAVIGVVIAASRGGLVVAVVALTVIPLLVRAGSVLPRVLLFTAVVGGIVATFAYAPALLPQIQDNLDRLAETDEQLLGGTLTGRTRIWSVGVDVYLSSPVVGIGVGTFSTAVEPFFGRRRAPHNAFLSVAVGAGFIGLILFMGVVLLPAASIFTLSTRRVEQAVLFIALVVAMMPTNSDNDKFVWFILGALAAARPVYLAEAAPPALTNLHRRSFGALGGADARSGHTQRS